MSKNKVEIYVKGRKNKCVEVKVKTKDDVKDPECSQKEFPPKSDDQQEQNPAAYHFLKDVLHA